MSDCQQLGATQSGCWELNSVLHEQCVLLTVEPPLQSLVQFLQCIYVVPGGKDVEVNLVRLILNV